MNTLQQTFLQILTTWARTCDVFDFQHIPGEVSGCKFLLTHQEMERCEYEISITKMLADWLKRQQYIVIFERFADISVNEEGYTFKLRYKVGH
jgi:hypothetical protein